MKPQPTQDADPCDLTIVGLDALPEVLAEDEDVLSFLDTESNDTPVSDGMVASIKAHGVSEPVSVRVFRYGKDGRCYVVVNGRSRCRAARRANEELTAAGNDAAALVRIKYYRKDDADVDDIVIANSWQRRGTPLRLAQRAKLMRARGRKTAEILTIMSDGDGQSMSRVTLANYESLLALPAALQALVSSGDMPLVGAYALAKMKGGHKAMLAAWESSWGEAQRDVSRTTAAAGATAADVDTDGAPCEPAPAAPPGRGPRAADIKAAAAKGLAPRGTPDAASPLPAVAPVRAPERADLIRLAYLLRTTTPHGGGLLTNVLEWAAGVVGVSSLAAIDVQLYEHACRVLDVVPKATALVAHQRPTVADEVM